MFDVLNYIHDNINKPISLSEAAKYFGYSKTYFSKKFNKFTGMNFCDYVRHYRIKLATIDVMDGKKITEIAFDYGYDTVGGFNKAFLKEYGCLPREYRNQAKESQLYYERRKNSMYKLTERCSMLREEMVNSREYEKYYAMQRIVYFDIATAEAELNGLCKTDIITAGLTNTLDKFSPVIIPGEIICGFNFGEYESKYKYKDKSRDELTVLMKESLISDEDINKFFDLNSHRAAVNNEPIKITSAEEQAGYEWAAFGRQMFGNHSVIGYEKVLRLGFDGLLKEVEDFEAKNGRCELYDAVKRICISASHIGEKYAQEAKRLLENGDSRYNKEDLETICKVCSKVPRHKAESFIEAVQAIWFAHIINTWEDTVNANSLGRLDQILFPYYKKDIEKGILTKEEAYEIVCCLWLKLYRDYDVQQSCVGGTLPDGTSAVNDLSYMMLDATEGLDFIRCLSVRCSEHTEKEFIQRALEVVGHVQKGIPFFFNDDVMIPALLSKGIAKEDAYNYTQLGCIETVIPGKSNPHAVTGEINFLKAIEYVLCNGHSLMYPEFSPGEKTGNLGKFDTYRKFYNAVLVQVEKLIELTCSHTAKLYNNASSPRPYKSLLTEGCLEAMRDFNEKGARYDYYQIMFGGIPNLADSLMVIKKFVYQDKKYTLSELKDILENNFPDESVRMEFINKASKFGNDIDEVDNIAVEITNFACDVLDKLSIKYNMDFHAQPFTYFWMIDHGNHSAASPDGRHKGDPIAYSVSPMQGRDFNGLTAVLNSISKFPTKRTPGTTSAIVEVDPKLFTDKNIGILADILIASNKKGLSNVQFNTIDADTLIDAKEHPDKYNNLAVRVSGFSQKFNLLSPELQEHIIGRTKHICL